MNVESNRHIPESNEQKESVRERFGLAEWNALQLRIFELVNAGPSWGENNIDAFKENSKIFEEVIEGLQEDDPVLLKQLLLLKTRITAGEEHVEISKVLEELAELLRSNSGFSEAEQKVAA